MENRYLEHPRRVALAVLLVLALLGLLLPAAAAGHGKRSHGRHHAHGGGPPITVMTRNLYR